MSLRLPQWRLQPKRIGRFPVRPSAPDQPADRPSDTTKPNPNHAAQEKTECIICLEELIGAQIAKLPCNHIFCCNCLQRLVLKAIKDERLFPVHCCPGQNLEINEFQEFLSPHIVFEYHEKSLEYNSANRKYCCDPMCGRFLRPDDIAEGLGTCQKCQKVTCTWCSRPLHEGDCPVDEGLQQVLRLAELNHWQRCKRCNGMVSKSTGCNRMNCACGASWCYSCGEPWQRLQTCRCENIYLIRQRTDEVTDLSTYTVGTPIVPENQLKGQGQFVIQHNEHRDPNAQPHRLGVLEGLIEDLDVTYLANHTVEEIHQEYTRRRWHRLLQERDRVVQEARDMLAREGLRQERGRVAVARQAGDIQVGERALQEEERARGYQLSRETRAREHTRQYRERFAVAQQRRDSYRAPPTFAMPEPTPIAHGGQHDISEARDRQQIPPAPQAIDTCAKQDDKQNQTITPQPISPASQRGAWALSAANLAREQPLGRYTRRIIDTILQPTAPFTYQEPLRSPTNPPPAFRTSSSLPEPVNDLSDATEIRAPSVSQPSIDGVGSSEPRRRLAILFGNRKYSKK